MLRFFCVILTRVCTPSTWKPPVIRKPVLPKTAHWWGKGSSNRQHFSLCGWEFVFFSPVGPNFVPQDTEQALSLYGICDFKLLKIFFVFFTVSVQLMLDSDLYGSVYFLRFQEFIKTFEPTWKMSPPAVLVLRLLLCPVFLTDRYVKCLYQILR